MVGLTDTRVTVEEGSSLECCFEIISGEAIISHNFLLVTLPITATGDNPTWFTLYKGPFIY